MFCPVDGTGRSRAVSLPGPGRAFEPARANLQRAECALVCTVCLGILSGATARYDDLTEGQLGDVPFKDGRTVIAVLGPNAIAAAWASPPPCLRQQSPARAPLCSWT